MTGLLTLEPPLKRMANSEIIQGTLTEWQGHSGSMMRGCTREVCRR